MNAATIESKTHKYNLSLPTTLFQEVQRIAEENDTTVLEVIKRFLKLGLLAVDVERRADAALILREGETEQVIKLLM